jgi:ribosomal protein S18 acetylase RimI-like enzyme
MGILIRPLRPEDRDPLEVLIRATGVFRPEEVQVAMEVVDAGLKKDQADYAFAVAASGQAIAGYACWGRTPCTQGTFDLYWIATHPAYQGRGVGRALMDAAWGDMRTRGGRLCVIETSSLPEYEPTRRFYLGLGCEAAAIIRDFYLPGDHKVVFTLKL